MTPGSYPLEIYRGDSYRWQFKLWNDIEKTDPVDLTGVTAKAEIRDKPGGKKITPITCTITAPNIIDATLSAVSSKAMAAGKGSWDLQLTYSGGDVSTVLAGQVLVMADVTDLGGAMSLDEEPIVVSVTAIEGTSYVVDVLVPPLPAAIEITVGDPLATIIVDAPAGGPPGPQGPQGEPGQSFTTFEYMFDAAPTEPATSSEVRFNSATPSLVTKVWIHDLSSLGRDNSNAFSLVDAGNRIFVQDKDDGAKYQSFDVTGAAIDKGAYTEFPVTWRASGATLAEQRVLVNIATKGIPGPQGEPGVTLTGGVAQSYTFGSTTAPPPMTGRFRLNNADQTIATIMWLHYVNEDGVDIKNYLTQRLRANDTLYIQDRDELPRWQFYQVSNAFTDSGVYATIPITWRAGGTSLTANARVVISRETAAQLVSITVGPTPPSSPAINDVWIDTT